MILTLILSALTNEEGHPIINRLMHDTWYRITVQKSQKWKRKFCKLNKFLRNQPHQMLLLIIWSKQMKVRKKSLEIRKKV